MVSRVDIHDTQVQAFIRPGGEVRDVLNEIVRDANQIARLFLVTNRYGGRNGSHVRSGRLLGGTHHWLAKDTGPLTAMSTLYNNTKHVRYFIEGTTGPITPKGQWGYLLVPRRVGVGQRSSASKGAGSELYSAWKGRGKKGVKGFFQKKSVRGQRAKPFLEDAVNAAFHLKGYNLR